MINVNPIVLVWMVVSFVACFVPVVYEFVRDLRTGVYVVKTKSGLEVKEMSCLWAFIVGAAEFQGELVVPEYKPLAARIARLLAVVLAPVVRFLDRVDAVVVNAAPEFEVSAVEELRLAMVGTVLANESMDLVDGNYTVYFPGRTEVGFFTAEKISALLDCGLTAAYCV
jgi:hypothetical protein